MPSQGIGSAPPTFVASAALPTPTSAAAARRVTSQKIAPLKTATPKIASSASFTRWLLSNHRLARDPLVGVKMLNVASDRRRERRALDDDELAALLRVAADIPSVTVEHRYIRKSGPNKGKLRLGTHGRDRADERVDAAPRARTRHALTTGGTGPRPERCGSPDRQTNPPPNRSADRSAPRSIRVIPGHRG